MYIMRSKISEKSFLLLTTIDALLIINNQEICLTEKEYNQTREQCMQLINGSVNKSGGCVNCVSKDEIKFQFFI